MSWVDMNKRIKEALRKVVRACALTTPEMHDPFVSDVTNGRQGRSTEWT